MQDLTNESLHYRTKGAKRSCSQASHVHVTSSFALFHRHVYLALISSEHIAKRRGIQSVSQASSTTLMSRSYPQSSLSPSLMQGIPKGQRDNAAMDLFTVADMDGDEAVSRDEFYYFYYRYLAMVKREPHGEGMFCSCGLTCNVISHAVFLKPKC
eukprot:1161647-Pelagomonas_calceolata.AAC.8